MEHADDDRLIRTIHCECGDTFEIWKSDLAWSCCNTFECANGHLFNSFGQRVNFHTCSDFPPPEFDPDYAGERW